MSQENIWKHCSSFDKGSFESGGILKINWITFSHIASFTLGNLLLKVWELTQINLRKSVSWKRFHTIHAFLYKQQFYT